MNCPVCGLPMAHYRLYGYQCSNPTHNQRGIPHPLGMRPEALTPLALDEDDDPVSDKARIAALEKKVRELEALLEQQQAGK